MDSVTETAAPSSVRTGAVNGSPTVPEDKPSTDLNPMARAPSLKFPVREFYSEDPELWFWQLEATFQVNRVTTEKDKYAVVVFNLPFKVGQRSPRTIASKQEPYTTLKKVVVKETDLSNYQRSKKLHALPTLVDQCPSKLLASIRNLQPAQDCGCYCARYHLLSRMPPITRAQLVNQKDLSVDELFALADTIMLSQPYLHNLMAEVEADRHNTDVLTVRQRSSALPPSKEKKKKARVKPEICWFHGRYGKDAKSCRQPCS